MATKKGKQITIKVIGCGNAVTFTVADTATEPVASQNLDAFKRGHAMEFTNKGNKILIPFHAVEYVTVSEVSLEVADKGDPYGCDEESEGD